MLTVESAVEDGWADGTGWDALARDAVEAAVRGSPYLSLLTTDAAIEVSVRFAGDDEVQKLNLAYRHKDAPTNVLSFPMVQRDLLDTIDRNSDDGEVLLGDIILAAGVCAGEAAEKGATIADHATHLVVHGTLHLLGYDHGDDMQAEEMEALERDILQGMGIADPYRVGEL